jgi:hypothetical protein
MRDEYASAFYDVVKDTRNRTGIEMPEYIEHYIVCLLASHVDKSDFLPTKTFAESILKISNSRDAKTLGDTCLFVTGIFPEYGLNVEYYSSIGKMSYNRCTHNLNIELFETLSKHFDHIRFFINHIRNDKYNVKRSAAR